MTDITQKIISFSPDVGTVLLALIKPIWAITAAMMARSIFHGIPTWSSYSKATVGLQSQLQVMVCGHALFGAVQAANWRPEEQNCDRKKSEGFAISEWGFTALTAIRLSGKVNHVLWPWHLRVHCLSVGQLHSLGRLSMSTLLWLLLPHSDGKARQLLANWPSCAQRSVQMSVAPFLFWAFVSALPHTWDSSFGMWAIQISHANNIAGTQSSGKASLEGESHPLIRHKTT